ncbi:MAG: cupin domain-containing protein [Oscillospiraceae bacterium]
MIKHAKDIPTETMENFKGGQGIVKLTKFATSEDISGKGRFMAYGVLEPGATQGYHQHFGEFETIYILEGKAKANDNGLDVSLNPGDVLICKDGNGHSLENIGGSDLKYIAVILNS